MPRLAIYCLLMFVWAPAWATSVVFLNPGLSGEPFWTEYSRFMQDAADDLGIELEVRYGERDVQRIVEQAREIAQRPHKPDYLLFANEMYTGPEILRVLGDSGIRLFALHSNLNAEQRARVGGPREQYRNWIGSLVPNDEEAGYLMARELLSRHPDRTELLAFSGVKNTPSSLLREAGLARALAEHPQVRMRQLLYGEWKRQRAYEQASALLPRYPQLDLIWSANDEMAMGVVDAAREQGRKLHITALNNSEAALLGRASGEFDALVSGHFLLGGCALVMLYDYQQGQDFAARGGVDQQANLLRLIDAKQAQQLKARLKREDIGLDFRSFSATRQPTMQRYACSIDSLLH